MCKNSPQNIYDDLCGQIESERIIAILRSISPERVLSVAEAMYAGGIRLLEVTYDATGRVSDAQTQEVIRRLVNHFDGRMWIGAGTVLTVEQVERTQEAGGCFIISPDVNPEVIRRTKALGMVSMPGALTPTEIQTAHLAGADYVKLFPATTFGPAYVKAVRAPLPHIKLLAVGGIHENNMTEYLNAGICGFGIGSNITKQALIDAEDYAGITRLAEKYCQVIRAYETHGRS